MRTVRLRTQLNQITMIEEPEFYNDLDSSLAAAWQLLVDGARDRFMLAHTPVLATLDERGLPTVRTVVLRKTDPQARSLIVHTDCRSPKFEQIRANPAGMVHVYEQSRKIQLRLKCELQVLSDGVLVDSRWAASHWRSQECYQVVQAPSSEVDKPEDVFFDASLANRGRDNFAIIVATINELEWVYLHEAGHRRARFSWQGDVPEACWLVP